MADKSFLDLTGLSTFWTKIKGKFLPLSGGTIAGNLVVSGEMTTQNLNVTDGDINVSSSDGNTALTLSSTGIETDESDSDKVFATDGSTVSLSDKLGSYLPLAGGTMKTNSTIKMPDSKSQLIIGTASSMSGTEITIGPQVTVTPAKISFYTGENSTTYITNDAITTPSISAAYGSFAPTESAGGTALSVENGAASFGGDVTVSGTLTADDVTTENVISISGDSGVDLSSGNGSVSITSDGGDVVISAQGEVQISSLAVEGSAEVSGALAANNFNYNGTITDSVALAWGASLFDFNSGSLVSAKVIGLDTTNKIATIMYGLKCPNPTVPLTIKDEYDDTVIGRVWGGTSNGYVGGFVAAVPYNGTSLDINTTYEVS